MSAMRISGTVTSDILMDGQHGFHVHESGDIQNGCGDAGGHFDPLNRDHGAQTEHMNRHIGDLGNINALGYVSGVEKVDLVALLWNSDYPNYSIMGRSIVIHADRDDWGQPTGNAGARLGCCQILEVDATAKCNFGGGSGDISGTLDITQYGGGTSSIQISGTVTSDLLTDGQHGFHVHENGDITNGCGDALGHFNPAGVDHGPPVGDGYSVNVRHVGDLGNVDVLNYASIVDISDSVALLVNTDIPAYSIMGLAIVIHDLPDDYGQPTGNAGDRIGCCTIDQVDEWSEWSEWSFCSVNCVQTRYRSCSIFAGSCEGDSTEAQACVTGFCDLSTYCMNEFWTYNVNNGKCEPDASIISAVCEDGTGMRITISKWFVYSDPDQSTDSYVRIGTVDTPECYAHWVDDEATILIDFGSACGQIVTHGDNLITISAVFYRPNSLDEVFWTFSCAFADIIGDIVDSSLYITNQNIISGGFTTGVATFPIDAFSMFFANPDGGDLPSPFPLGDPVLMTILAAFPAEFANNLRIVIESCDVYAGQGDLVNPSELNLITNGCGLDALALALHSSTSTSVSYTFTSFVFPESEFINAKCRGRVCLGTETLEECLTEEERTCPIGYSDLLFGVFQGR